MVKKLFALMLLFCIGHKAYALDNQIIAKVQMQTRVSFIDHCQVSLKNLPAQTCKDLADQAAKNIDVAALSLCTNDEKGMRCMIDLIRAAVYNTLVNHRLG